MKPENPIKKIIITGPESTGKSTLAKQLSKHFNTIFIPEFAREYITKINRAYTYEDLIIIAKKQIEVVNKTQYNNSDKLIFFDTGLIITKIWFLEVYNKVPNFVEEAINKNTVNLYLLCFPDILWIPDKVRENGGEKRLYLFNKYKNELDKNNFKYFIIKGDNEYRLSSAIKYLSSAYCL